MQLGKEFNSTLTIELIPKAARAPLTMPQGKCSIFIADCFDSISFDV